MSCPPYLGEEGSPVPQGSPFPQASPPGPWLGLARWSAQDGSSQFSLALSLFSVSLLGVSPSPIHSHLMTKLFVH